MDQTFLEKLSTARGIPGQEGVVRAILQETLADHVDELTTDSLGNLIARKRPKTGGSSLRVMLAAHMDEVGFVVVKVNKDSTLKVRNVGGIDPRILPGKRVLVGAEAIPGVILRKPVHLQSRSEESSITAIKDLTVDVGGVKNIEPGAMVTFEGSFGSMGRLLKGKSFDDRIGCYNLVQVLMQNDVPCEVVGAFTVQEEIGLRGAKVAAYGIQPHVALALEGTIADDMPKDEDVSPTTELGKGPALSVMDRSAYADRRLVDLLMRTADDNGIPWQIKQPGVGGTDVGTIHLAREGIPATALSVPCRYIHAPAALLDPTDVEHTVKLLIAGIERLAAEWR